MNSNLDKKTSSPEPETINESNNNPPIKKNAFVHKLYSMLSDEKLSHLIWWNENSGAKNTFSLLPGKEFSKILSNYFKHGNVASFVRQLHMYGFHKVNDNNSDNSIWEFKHSSGKFRKDDEESLVHIKRRSSANPTKGSYLSMNVSPAPVPPPNSAYPMMGYQPVIPWNYPVQHQAHAHAQAQAQHPHVQPQHQHQSPPPQPYYPEYPYYYNEYGAVPMIPYNVSYPIPYSYVPYNVGPQGPVPQSHPHVLGPPPSHVPPPGSIPPGPPPSHMPLGPVPGPVPPPQRPQSQSQEQAQPPSQAHPQGPTPQVKDPPRANSDPNMVPVPEQRPPLDHRPMSQPRPVRPTTIRSPSVRSPQLPYHRPSNTLPHTVRNASSSLPPGNTGSIQQYKPLQFRKIWDNHGEARPRNPSLLCDPLAPAPTSNNTSTSNVNTPTHSQPLQPIYSPILEQPRSAGLLFSSVTSTSAIPPISKTSQNSFSAPNSNPSSLSGPSNPQNSKSNSVTSLTHHPPPIGHSLPGTNTREFPRSLPRTSTDERPRPSYFDDRFRPSLIEIYKFHDSISTNTSIFSNGSSISSFSSQRDSIGLLPGRSLTPPPITSKPTVGSPVPRSQSSDNSPVNKVTINSLLKEKEEPKRRKLE